MNIRVIVNRDCGTVVEAGDGFPGQLRAILRSLGADADIRLIQADGIADAFGDAAAAKGLDIVVAGGGDGTINCAAGHLADTGRTLGILPLGTLNHLARDAGIPTALAEAAAVVVAGHVREIDAGDVNGKIFLNNSSVGLYPMIVRERDAERRRLGRSKRLAMLSAALKAMRRFSDRELTIELYGSEAPVRTPLLFVGNNRYETSLLTLGRREALDAHELCIYAPLVRTRLQFLSLALRGLIGLSKQRDFLSLHGVTEAVVDARRRLASVARDGETEWMEMPLRYRLRPKAVRLIVPGRATST